jgi:hypothetical protein
MEMLSGMQAALQYFPVIAYRHIFTGIFPQHAVTGKSD